MGKLTLLKDYAEKCGLPVRTLRRLCQDGTLPAMQIGRAYYVDTDAADAELAATVQQATSRKRIRIVEPTKARRVKKFDFLAELAKA